MLLFGPAISCLSCLSVACLPSKSQAYVFPHVFVLFWFSPQVSRFLRNRKSLVSAICSENKFCVIFSTNIVLYYYITTESKTERRRGWSIALCRCHSANFILTSVPACCTAFPRLVPQCTFLIQILCF